MLIRSSCHLIIKEHEVYMVLIEEESFYTIKRDYTLSPTDRDVLVRLYGPIIGAVSLNIYFVLDTLADSIDVLSEGLNEDLIRVMNLNYAQFDEGRKKLEACNLIETYRYEDAKKINYIYNLLPPASPKKFMAKNNIVLRGLLIKTMGNKYLTRMKNHFAIDSKISPKFEKINAKISMMFDYDLDDKGCFYIDNDSTEFEEKKYKKVEDNFDINSFKKMLNEEQISFSIIEGTIEEIIRISTIYSVPLKKCVSLVQQSINSENVFSIDYFKKKAIDSVKYSATNERPEVFVKDGDTITAVTMQKFDSLSPTDYLYSISHTTPLKSELRLIDKISSEYGFSSGIINVILDYTLKQCDNKLPEAFVLKMCATLKRNKVSSTYEAMNDIYRSATKAIKAKKNKNDPDDRHHSISDSEEEEKTVEIMSDINDIIGDEV